MNLSGLSLRDMEYVVAVADLGSFVKAAEHCHVAQPSLSVQVSKLESRLGTVIFERTTRRLILTSDGHLLIEQMRRVLAEGRALVTLARRSNEPFGGTLRLSAIATLGPYYFPQVLPTLRAQYPNLSLVLGEGRTDALVAALLQGQLDAVLMSTPVLEAGLSEMPLFLEPFIMACPSGHRALESSGTAWTELDPTERLLLEEGHCLRDQAIAACDDISASNRHATGLETLKYMVAAGEGCTLMPALAATETNGIAYTLLPRDGYARTIVLTWRRSDPRSAEFEALGESLRQFRHPAIEHIQPLRKTAAR